MTIFRQIKELVDVPSAARYYGYEVSRNNMICCPFHNERTPSCKLYERNYLCFSCNAHGDVIDLVQRLFGLTSIEAAKQINNDFCLGLDMDKPADNAYIKLMEKARSERESYKQGKITPLMCLISIYG